VKVLIEFLGETNVVEGPRESLLRFKEVETKPPRRRGTRGGDVRSNIQRVPTRKTAVRTKRQNKPTAVPSQRTSPVRSDF